MRDRGNVYGRERERANVCVGCEREISRLGMVVVLIVEDYCRTSGSESWRTEEGLFK